MARLNGEEVGLIDLELNKVGERLLVASPTSDGKGLELQLTEDEQDRFDAIAPVTGVDIGQLLVFLLMTAIRERTGRGFREHRIPFHYDREKRTFTTNNNPQQDQKGA